MKSKFDLFAIQLDGQVWCLINTSLWAGCQSQRRIADISTVPRPDAISKLQLHRRMRPLVLEQEFRQLKGLLRRLTCCKAGEATPTHFLCAAFNQPHLHTNPRSLVVVAIIEPVHPQSASIVDLAPVLWQVNRVPNTSIVAQLARFLVNHVI